MASAAERQRRRTGPQHGGPADPRAVRRAPFSDNPTVGPRGQRTQQRILDATLRVLREEGYHRASVDRITRRAGCSRVSFYQYFSSKEDVFYRLAGHVARQVGASIEALELITPDAAGHAQLRAWVARESEIYERYGPVFNAFGVAAAGVAAVADLGAAEASANVSRLHSRLATVCLPAREIDAVLRLLLACLARTFHLADVLRSAEPSGYPHERIEEALGDALHRALFGLQPAVNVHPAAGSAPPPLRFAPSTRAFLDQPAPESAATSTSSTLETLLAAGRSVLVRRGFHATRVDDIAAEAGLSHGLFYRYFKNKEDFAHALVLQAMRSLSHAFAEIPDSAAAGATGRTALRRWLRHYNASYLNEAAIIRVWVDAGAQDATLWAESAPAVDWGRRRVAAFLRPRGFGDVDAEAVVMVALLDAFGSQPRGARTIDAVAHIIQRGLLGQ